MRKILILLLAVCSLNNIICAQEVINKQKHIEAIKLIERVIAVTCPPKMLQPSEYEKLNIDKALIKNGLEKVKDIYRAIELYK